MSSSSRSSLSSLSSPLNVAEAELWVREGVCDALIADQLFELIQNILRASRDHDACELGLSMHYLRGLSGRHLLSVLSEVLSQCLQCHEHIEARCWMQESNPLNDAHLDTPWFKERLIDEDRRDGVSAFAPMSSLYARPTLGESALVLIAELAPPGHPAKQQALRYASSHLSLYTRSALTPERTIDDQNHVHLTSWLTTWLWDHLDIRDELTPLLPHASRCLQGSEERQTSLAIRLALIRPQDALEMCQALKTLDLEERKTFATLLEKQLKRVGKIRLWVACRQALLHA